jgi:predicted choloylglycine hydrolase
MIRKLLLTLSLGALLVWTWAIVVFHLGVFLPPPHSEQIDPAHQQLWIPKAKFGINQMILTGSPFERGLASGRFTRDLLREEESNLVGRLRTFFPNRLLLSSLQVLMIRWFWGADRYFEPWTLEEMDGVSRSSSSEFNDLGNSYIRQLYYHGLHEVGQMMVDRTGDDMGCTIAAYPAPGGWIIGRNFDFEGGKVFDDEKIMKWVFPDQGYAYLSVIWAGMVGAVTGVNEQGLFVAINAAGTRDFRRYGTPTSLVLLKALQFAKSSDEAVEIIRNAQTFITEIFTVSDRTTGKFFKIEKSPYHTEVIRITSPTVIGNHLVSEEWQGDSLNSFRRDQLTSLARTKRGEQLIALMSSADRNSKNSQSLEEGVLTIMRDKGEANGQALHLGNRNAIDGLVATHGIIYDSAENRLFVSQGPSLTGAFTGFDLTESFRRHEPVGIRGLPHDPALTDRTYAQIKLSFHDLTIAEGLLRKKKCSEATPWLESARYHFPESYSYSMALGDYHACLGDGAAALVDWKEALRRSPAYASERGYLNKRLKEK